MGPVWDQYAAWGNYTVTEGDVITFAVNVTNLADSNAVLKPAPTPANASAVEKLVEHANFHACKIDTGFCTPLVGTTPGLVTHAPAPQPVQSPCWPLLACDRVSPARCVDPDT